jgi:hypothetical protein
VEKEVMSQKFEFPVEEILLGISMQITGITS